MDGIEIMREAERFRRTGVSRVQWWRLEQAGKAPPRVQLGPNSVGWVRSEIDAWLTERVTARNEQRADNNRDNGNRRAA
jgi:prophage regulatory protein